MAEKEEAKPAVPAKKSKKGLVLAMVAVLVLGAGGGGAWWFMGKDDGEAKEAKVAPPLPPVFVPLDNFTVNLQPEPGSQQQYMQIGITLKIAGQDAAEKLKVLMPEVRSSLLLLLSAKKASELLSPDGKTKLAQEMMIAVARILDPGFSPAAASVAAETAEPEKIASAPAETSTDASEQKPEAEAASDTAAAEAPAAPAAAATAEPATAGPVLSVLFTSLIIQ